MLLFEGKASFLITRDMTVLTPQVMLLTLCNDHLTPLTYIKRHYLPDPVLGSGNTKINKQWYHPQGINCLTRKPV